MQAKKVLIWLNALGISDKKIHKILDKFEDFSKIKDIKEIDFLYKDIFTKKDIEKIELNPIESFLNRYFKNMDKDIKITTLLDSDYPIPLKEIENNPIVLYSYGEYDNENDPLSISFVGSRKASAYGISACESLVKDIAKIGITVVSGLAYGIDRVAHETALKHGTKTIGVLGCGIDIIYPQENKLLYDSMKKNGIIISQFPIGEKPRPYNFPIRNNIIAGLSLGTVVVEAMEKSGSLITANYALEHGKSVFAVPGNINSLYSKGTNALIKEGAKIVTNYYDILEDLEGLKHYIEKENLNNKFIKNFSENENIIYNSLKISNKNAQELSVDTSLSINEVLFTITSLELKGLLKDIGGVFTLI